jgi:hypothetical protein
MGKIEKGVNCSIEGCKNMAVRSVSGIRVEASGLAVKDIRRAYLCESHYREFKKRSREERLVERWRWSV